MKRAHSIFDRVCCHRNNTKFRYKELCVVIHSLIMIISRTMKHITIVIIGSNFSKRMVSMNGLIIETYHSQNKQVIQLRECPLCPPHKKDITNPWTLGIFSDPGGGWNCFRCGNHGNQSSLIQIFNNYGTQNGVIWDDFDCDYMIDNEYMENEESEICSISRNEDISDETIDYENELLLKEEPLLNRLCLERNLSIECFRDYQCGLKYGRFGGVPHAQQCITFPMYQYKNKRFVATKYKMRCVSNGIKQFVQYPLLSESGLFGFKQNNTNHKTNKVVITEGEFDSMAIYHATEYKVKALSVPNGANGISDTCIKQLLHFYNDFVLFLDWDNAGEQSAHRLSDKIYDLGGNVQIVHKSDALPDVKDANDILIKYGQNEGKQRLQDIMQQYGVV
eukprot:76139_1